MDITIMIDQDAVTWKGFPDEIKTVLAEKAKLDKQPSIQQAAMTSAFAPWFATVISQCPPDSVSKLQDEAREIQGSANQIVSELLAECSKIIGASE
jgi:hypothetical protein